MAKAENEAGKERVCGRKDCGRRFTADRYNSWRKVLYCGPKCAREAHEKQKGEWRRRKLGDPRWAEEERARAADRQKARRARLRAAKAAAARRETDAEAALESAKAEAASMRRAGLLLLGLCVEFSGAETAEEVARFSDRMLDKAVRLGGGVAPPPRHATDAFQAQATCGP